MEWIADPQIWIAFATLTVLELVLGIDNVIFISILAGKLPEEQRGKARIIGLSMALVMRVILLFSLKWVMGLTTPLVSMFGFDLSGRDLILLIGGLFLIGKSTHEIHGSLESEDPNEKSASIGASFASVIVQITLLDIVFSLDSVITAVGMVGEISLMAIAIVMAVIVMLVAEGLHQHIPKGYIYFAMAFSVAVEFLNMRLRGKGKPVELRDPYALHKAAKQTAAE